jgi:hypothetical protein
VRVECASSLAQSVTSSTNAGPAMTFAVTGTTVPDLVSVDVGSHAQGLLLHGWTLSAIHDRPYDLREDSPEGRVRQAWRSPRSAISTESTVTAFREWPTGSWMADKQPKTLRNFDQLTLHVAS